MSAKIPMDKDWCMAMAHREVESEIGALQWAVIRLRSALENWGRHHEWCALRDDSTKPCSCGLAEILAATVSQGEREESERLDEAARVNLPVVARVPLPAVPWERTVAKSALENYGRHHAWCELLKDPLGICDCGFSKTLDEIGRRRCAKCEGVLAELPVTGGFCMSCGNQPDIPAADSRDTEAPRRHHAPHAKRYAMRFQDDCWGMDEVPDGSYVRFDDYEALRRQYDATADHYRDGLSYKGTERCLRCGFWKGCGCLCAPQEMSDTAASPSLRTTMAEPINVHVKFDGWTRKAAIASLREMIYYLEHDAKNYESMSPGYMGFFPPEHRSYSPIAEMESSVDSLTARAVRAEEEAWTAYRRGYLDGTAYRPPEGSPDTFETLSAVADARASQHVEGRRAFAVANPRPATP